MINPRAIKMIDAWTYLVPTYKVTDEGIQDGEGIMIHLCRGNMADQSVPRQEGLFSETLLWVILAYLESVNVGDLRNRDTSIAITAIEDALLRLGKRAEDRKFRGVQATYQK